MRRGAAGAESLMEALLAHGCVRHTCQRAPDLGCRVLPVKDGQSSPGKDAARLIQEWNRRPRLISHRGGRRRQGAAEPQGEAFYEQRVIQERREKAR